MQVSIEEAQESLQLVNSAAGVAKLDRAEHVVVQQHSERLRQFFDEVCPKKKGHDESKPKK